MSGEPHEEVVTELEGIGRSTGARTAAVKELSERALRERKCPFCSSMLTATSSERMIMRTEHWNVFHNVSPFPGTDQHIMVASHLHVLGFSDLLAEAKAEFFDIIHQLEMQFGYISSSLVVRMGDPSFNSATVYHLHAHVIVSDGKPATEAMVNEEHRTIIEALMDMLPEHPEGSLEALDELREAIDVWRAAQQYKAVPIRAKLNNKVGHNGQSS